MASEKISKDLIQIPTGISNAYLVGDKRSFALVDSGTQGNTENILEATREHFGSTARPEVIVLTHGHFDHSGSANELAEHWDVEIMAHPLEHPYLDGRDTYPPPDPTVGGFMAQVVRFLPIQQPNVGIHLEELDVDGEIPGMQDWMIIETPGHSPGHVSFFRKEDRALIAGDAFCTMNQDSMFDTFSRRKIVSRPPTYYTIDWEEAEASVRRLAALGPRVLAAGHGVPMTGRSATSQLERLAADFPIPEHGRYVEEPAQANEDGVTYLPPPPADPVKWAALAAGGAVLAGLGVYAAYKRNQQRQWRDLERAA